ncbi:nuclease (SNase-like) protein [Nitratireductor indicus C115]|uniref:Nuclease (SNase-like) protein n=2 Tax=Nitratireductor indicus TaxID=721133 RepID=K2P1A8_9HYPH|nr:thermonuclease family protein [Nitratireductor indicus]EKF43949.1 nuclease (SNase-like) protein [Nitratireductor indicus C115]
MPICGSGQRVNCVVDGDTIWINREKFRLEGFNAPEMNGSCDRERRLAVQARDELRRALNGHRFTIERNGQDRYGRTLATIRVEGRDVGQGLIRKGLAHEWRGFKENWC